MGFVHHAITAGLGFANVITVASDGSFEETGTAVAGENAVVLAGAVIATHFAWDVVKDAT